MPEPDCFLRYRISAATWNFTSGKSHRWYAATASCSFKMVLFTEPSEDLCQRYIRPTECPSSLFWFCFVIEICFAQWIGHRGLWPSSSWSPLLLLLLVSGLFVPLYFRSREWKVHRENFRSHGTFVPWNIRSLELSLLWKFRSSGANVPRTFVPMKLSYHENEYSKNFCCKCPKTRPINLTIAYVH